MNPIEEFNAFNEKQTKSDYDFDSMTTEQQDAEMLEYTRLKIAKAKYETKIKEFRDLQVKAMDELVYNQILAKEALQSLWEAKEANDYDINYVPQ